MEEIKLMHSLKDMINIRFDKFKDRVAFLEKFGTSKEFEEIKYKKLKDDINGLGTYMLKKMGLENKKIAVIGENSSRWYITYMAVVCGVGVIVPLDKELPANEILNLMQRSKASAIVYSDRKKEAIDAIRDKLPKDMIYINMNIPEKTKNEYSFDRLVEAGRDLVDTGNIDYIEKEIDREAFSVLLFTSGTTGTSKGVMLNHKNLANNLYAAEFIIPQMGEYRLLSVLPMHHTFEFTVTYLYGTYSGSTIGICEGLKYFVKNIKEIKPDVLVCVPALVERVDQRIEKALKEQNKEKLVSTMRKLTTGLSKIGIDLRKKVFKQIQDNLGGNVKIILCGGAPIDAKLVEKMESYGFIFMQGYGLTETAPLITTTLLKDRVAGTVGKPIKNMEVRIDLSANVDENSNIGEIIVKGDNVMMGYYENEEETNKVLNKGWFFTGDIGYFDIKGNLVISGRSKNVIVTSNGKKIFPEEIENLINQIPLVEESMVYGKPSKKNKNEVLVTARVTLDEEYIEENYASKRPTDEEIYNIIWNEIKKINRSMVGYKAVKELEIKKDKFSKTTTMKIKRFEEMKKK